MCDVCHFSMILLFYILNDRQDITQDDNVEVKMVPPTSSISIF